MKKIFGYIFLAASILLTLAILGQLPRLFATVFNLFKAFTGKLDAEQVGFVIGTSMYWVFHFAVTIVLWITGLRWIKNKSNPA